jgi:uncharacterized protein
MIDAALAHPPYDRLVELILTPFLKEPATLRVDCEYLPTHARVWVRVAFAEGDRQQVLGGSNRHLYALKTILNAAARPTGQSVYLDIYGGTGNETRTERPPRPGRPSGPRSGGSRPSRPRP